MLTTPSLGPQGTALVHHNNPMMMNHGNTDFSRADDGFDRPPPRAAELYNPKIAKRPHNHPHPHMHTQGQGQGGEGRLSEQIRAMSLSDGPLHASSSSGSPTRTTL